MLFRNSIAFFAFAALALADGESRIIQLRNRIPGSHYEASAQSARSLYKRANEPTFAANCDTEMEVPGVDGPVTITKKTYIDHRFKDAIEIAGNVAGISQDHSSIDAFTNYFFLPSQSTYPGANEHLARFKDMMAKIHAKNYLVRFLCPNNKEDATCRGKSLAYTDARRLPAGTATSIVICPHFFESDSTKLRFTSRLKNNKGWGKPDLIFKDLETGGHTILHELTHVDAIASAAGLPDLDANDGAGLTAATRDFGSKSSATTCRKLKQDIVKREAKNRDLSTLKDPMKSAESYAAAALEFWVRTVGKREVPIKLAELD